MAKNVVVITGAAGFIGSSLVVELSRQYQVFAIDRRKPTSFLIMSAPGVHWINLDIKERSEVDRTFKKIKRKLDKIDFVIHLAAYYHFGNDWRQEYEETNITGTSNIIDAAIDSGVKQFIFSSSIAAIEPLEHSISINEKSPPGEYIPYARSKAMGEMIVKNASDRIQCIILRLGGVFSDWCELPPLFALIRQWSSKMPFSNWIPGKGKSAIPYIHVYDVIQSIKQCLILHRQFDACEVFIISAKGSVSHNELFKFIKGILYPENRPHPVYIPPELLGIGLWFRSLMGMLLNKDFFEKLWMINYIDRPWITDNSYSEKKLGWKCSAGRSVQEKLPVILNNFKTDKKVWIDKNIQRNKGNYSFNG